MFCAREPFIPGRRATAKAKAKSKSTKPKANRTDEKYTSQLQIKEFKVICFKLLGNILSTSNICFEDVFSLFRPQARKKEKQIIDWLDGMDCCWVDRHILKPLKRTELLLVLEFCTGWTKSTKKMAFLD